jgi:hypothetical protein
MGNRSIQEFPVGVMANDREPPSRMVGTYAIKSGKEYVDSLDMKRKSSKQNFRLVVEERKAIDRAIAWVSCDGPVVRFNVQAGKLSMVKSLNSITSTQDEPGYDNVRGLFQPARERVFDMHVDSVNVAA